MRLHRQLNSTDILPQAAFAALCVVLGLASSWGILVLLLGLTGKSARSGVRKAAPFTEKNG